MAEIGIIASVIAVAGAGFRLSLILNAVGCEIATAGMEIHSISKGVTLFSLMLKQVGQALQASDSVHSSEALETAQEIATECQMVFDEIQEMLDKVTSKRADGAVSASIQQKFRWCFKKGRVQYLLGQLESLKMSLLVMLQILQLGKLMASTPRNDQEAEVMMKNGMIAQERAETQNLVIVRYWQINRLDRLFAAAEHEDAEERKKEIEHQNNDAPNTSQLAIEAPPPEYSMSTALIRLPIVSLGELDNSLNRIRESPRDMLRASESVIDPLLDRWTRWQEIRDQQDVRPGGRFMPTVQNLYEPDEEKPKYYGDFREREESPRGYYLEGTTTDWRKPHSVAARQEAARLRKKYVGLQPSVSVENSDVEDGDGFRRHKRRAPSRHVIDSSSETSDSERELPRPRRRSNADSSNGKRYRYSQHGASLSQSHGNGDHKHASFGGRIISSPNATPQSTPGSSFSAPRSPGFHRPMTNPVQNHHHHAYTTPLPPVHPPNAPYQYTPHSPYPSNSNATLQPPAYPGYSNSQHYPPRYMPSQGHRIPIPPHQFPATQEGRSPRSPSRLSGHSVHSQRSVEDLKKSERSRKHKNLTKSATKGVLGAGALAGFLEALEGLEL